MKSFDDHFTLIFRQHHRFVVGVLRGLGVSGSQVEDAAQEVFLTTFRRWGEIQPDEGVRGWLYSIARNVARHTQRSDFRHARRTAAYAEQPKHPSADVAADLESFDFMATVTEALDDDLTKDVFLLTALGGVSSSEVASELDIPAHRVHSCLRTARRRLKKELTRLGPIAIAGIIGSYEGDAVAAQVEAHMLSLTHAPLSAAEAQLRLTAMGTAHTALKGGTIASASLTPLKLGGGLLALGVTMGLVGFSLESNQAPRLASLVASSHSPAEPEAQESLAPAWVALAPSLAEIDASPRAQQPEAANHLQALATTTPDQAPRRARRRATPEPERRDEFALLQAMERAVNKHSWREVLRAVDDYERRFPAGQFHQEVLLWEARARCGLGQQRRVESIRASFITRWPDSFWIRELNAICSDH